MIRQAAVAGSFYPADPTVLKRDLSRLIPADVKPSPATAIIVPHAGYVYSGAVAGEVMATTRIPKTVIMVGPNHHGAGPDIAVSGAHSWATPLADVPLSRSLREQICAECTSAVIDNQAHQFEHSLEVMLPLLLECQPALEIVPIALRSLSYAAVASFGAALARVIAASPAEILLLASSDMNHFLDAETTEKLDFMAISAMTSFAPEQLYRTVVDNRISMCGVLPAVAVMVAAKELGANDCRLVRYAHSGQINGDNSRVVGYAGLSIC